MNVRNCRSCGKLFNYVIGPPICPSCKEKAEEKFQVVKSFIRENPGVSIQEVTQECDVDKAQINQWLREERLELSDSSAITLSCERCGTQIKSGKYCEKCKNEMTSGFQKSMGLNESKKIEDPVKKAAKAKMRFLE